MTHMLGDNVPSASITPCHGASDILEDALRDSRALTTIGDERAGDIIDPPHLGDLLLQIDVGGLLEEGTDTDRALVAGMLFSLDYVGECAGMYLGTGDDDWIPVSLGAATDFFGSANSFPDFDECRRVNFDESLLSSDSRRYTCSGANGRYGDLLVRLDGRIKDAWAYSPLLERLLLGLCGYYLLMPLVGGGDGLWHAVSRFNVLDVIDDIDKIRWS